jgi:hypothetical protein
LEKLLQKMDEYIRADNDFCQRREEAYRFSEMTRGFEGRIHPTEATIFLASFGTATKLSSAASSKRQRRQGLRRKV